MLIIVLYKKMVILGLLPNFNIDKRYKCKVCIESKFARKPFMLSPI